MDEASKQIDYCTASCYYIYKNRSHNKNKSLYVNSLDEVLEYIARMNIFLDDESKTE